MRVTFVLAQVDLSGGCRVVSIYAQRLMARGHRVTVVAPPRPRLSTSKRLLSLLRRGGASRRREAVASHFEGTNIDVRLLNERRPVTDADVPDADVVVATWWETAEWTQAFSKQKGARAYLIQHYEAHEYLPVDRVLATWRAPQQKIVVASWLARIAAAEFGDEDAIVVPNSVDLDVFRAPPRSRHRPPAAGLLYAPVTPWKGTDVALDAYRRARKRVPELQLVALSRYARTRALPLPEETTFHEVPAQDQLAGIYASCDVWIHGARSEGFGLPVLEAFACRCPAVSTRCGGPEDIVEDGVNGFLVPVDDPQALADRVVELVTMEDARWARMSEAARIRAERYTWDDATQLFESALEQAVKRRAGL